MHTLAAFAHDVHAPHQHFAESHSTSWGNRDDATSDATADKTAPSVPYAPLIRATDDEDVYRVQSEEHLARFYHCNAKAQTCSCWDWTRRRRDQPTGREARWCKHLAALYDHLIEEALAGLRASVRPRQNLRALASPLVSPVVSCAPMHARLAPLCSCCYERPAAAGDTQCGHCLMAEVFPTPPVPGAEGVS